MTFPQFHIVQPTDELIFKLIADWYLSEWKIPLEKTMQQLPDITADPLQFQVLMMLDNAPIGTGGVYNHVGLLDREPRFTMYKKWLAVVYTLPEQRMKGYGELICKYIQNHAKSIGIDQLHLYTDTAERLYLRNGWSVVERVSVGGRNLAIMSKLL